MRHNPAMYLFFALLALPLPAWAARVEPRALLLLGGYSHWASLEYQYDGQSTKADRDHSSRQHWFKEEYSGEIPYAILDTRIWRGSLGAGVIFDQDFASSTGSESRTDTGARFRYNFQASILERSAFPLNIFTMSELVHVQREFSSPYDIQLNTFGANLVLKNRQLPAQFNYTRTSSQTSGLDLDRDEVSDSMVGSVNHSLGISDSEASLSMSQSSTELESEAVDDLHNRSYEVNLRNKLRLSQKYDRSLSSHFSERQESRERGSDREVVRVWTLDELVTWTFGKALTSGANFLLNNRESDRGTDRYESGRVYLQHLLFESLTTQAELGYRKDSLVEGDEDTLSGALGFIYTKVLPRDSRLQLTYNESYQLIDRNFSGSAITPPEERVTAVADPLLPGLVAPIVLTNPNVVPESVQVVNAESLVPYSPVTDYRLEQVGLQTRIVVLPGSTIVVGSNLLISYTFLANPNVKYATSSRGGGFNLPLFNHAYRFYGNWFSTDQDLKEGSEDVLRMTGKTVYRLGFEATRPALSYGVDYENADSEQDKHYTVSGFVRSTRKVRDGLLSLYTADSFTSSEANSFTSGTQSSTTSANTFTLGGSYTANLFSSAYMTLDGKYLNTRGDVVARDDLSLGGRVQWRYGKLSATLQSQVNWRFAGDVDTRDEFVRLVVTRYF